MGETTDRIGSEMDVIKGSFLLIYMKKKSVPIAVKNNMRRKIVVFDII